MIFIKHNKEKCPDALYDQVLFKQDTFCFFQTMMLHVYCKQTKHQP